ncbi:uncharacterized protein LOC126766058 [Bactrocera neohumeralis]|uniref:uncharacterized protein LOC126766058 n=1 Tax=Bactrocera neohumeralis TaxID=98809 RepID=UPI002166887D|nr:uncharacterized protein LOC126766058 [Bactrocera neohumeralis]
MPRARRANIGRRTRHNTNRLETRRSQTEEMRAPENVLRQQTQHNPLPSQARIARIPRRLANEMEFSAFNYNFRNDYARHANIGQMSVRCEYCDAAKFLGETAGMCCANGKVKLPPFETPPDPLRTLIMGTSPQSKHFLAHIQEYNAVFQMTSFGASNIVRDNFMPTFKVISSCGISSSIGNLTNTIFRNFQNSDPMCPYISLTSQIQGQIYHRTGSLLPFPDREFSFLQIYFIGDANRELDRRCAIASHTRREIVSHIQRFLHQYNELVTLFKTALDRMPSDNHRIIIRADKTPFGEHARRFNAPTLDEVAIVIVGEQTLPRDIILHRRNEQLQRVSELHRSYDALQYPLLHWKGDDGYHINIPMVNPQTGLDATKKMSAMNFYSHRFMIRPQEDNYILRCGRLFHQYAVDMYVKIESERLNYLRFNQARLRSEEYIHLRDAVVNDGNVNDIGRLTILPSSYVGSPRHMHEYTQDAMTYVHKYGRPDLFVTFTCNPQWADITNNLYDGQKSTDRHDITARVFRQKVKALMDMIVKLKIFGPVRCWMYSIEWQKRGLPHAHILIWLVRKITPDQTDDIISAEIPYQAVDPDLFEIVKKNMIHGPCGPLNMNSPCMIDRKCSKRYPRPLTSDTITGNDGYPLYRRRSPNDNGHTAMIRMQNQDIVIDNSWVVPYNPLLSKAFNAHINVEICNSVKSIKYICKYVNKGSDMAVFGVTDPNANDEITQYQMGRYISTNEALWRIFSFPIHERFPAVVHLAVHLENGQRVYFTNENVLQRAEQPPATTLTAFIKLCRSDEFARTLLYSDVPHYYTWVATSKKWQRRKQGTPVDGHPGVFFADTIGRVYTVHPNNAECYYLRLLLVNVAGPLSFQHLRTVNGQLCQTYREACQLLQLLENDSHWDLTLQDAAIASAPHNIRMLFAIIISTCFPSNPLELWNKYKDYMAEDILIRMRHRTRNQDLLLTLDMYNEALIALEDLCLAIANKALGQLGLPSANRPMHDLFDRELQREREYDANELQTFVNLNVPKLNVHQRHVYDTIMQAVNNRTGGLYFLDAPGGTGKTFVISLILAAIRSQNKIALALASSGIAATLLDGGRTAHSALKLPLNVHVLENPTCNISRNSAMAKVLRQTDIILLDECTMTHKKSLEALDRTLKDIRGNAGIFGGALILLSGDFRQTLPVIPRSTPADEINACLKSSILWRHVQTMTLNINMRVQLNNDPSAYHFSKQLLDIGNGKIQSTNGFITLPNNCCTIVESHDELIDRVFPNIVGNIMNHTWLRERAILAPKNVNVNDINFEIQEKLPGVVTSYKSFDSAMNQDDAVNYPIEFLNSLEPPGMPPHCLNLKIGSSIILLRNLNAPKLCNGTRLAVKKLMLNLIEATILTGTAKGDVVLIPRIPIIPTDMPFEFKRLQFPVRLAFAMSINKAQGQTLKVCDDIEEEETDTIFGQINDEIENEEDHDETDDHIVDDDEETSVFDSSIGIEDDENPTPGPSRRMKRRKLT